MPPDVRKSYAFPRVSPRFLAATPPFSGICNLSIRSHVLQLNISNPKIMKNNHLRAFLLITAVFTLWLLPTSAQQPAPQPTPVEIKIDPATFDAYTGQYEDAVNLGGTIFSFFREGDKYYLRVVNQDRLELAASSANIFFVKENGGLTAEFVRDANGRPTEMIWRQGGQTFRAKRIA